MELTFRPNPAVRTVDEHVEFCTSGPRATPHITAQQLLPPGATRAMPTQLEAGRYRLRMAGVSGWQMIQAAPDGMVAATVRIHAEGLTVDEPDLALAPTLNAVNDTGDERLLILERAAWTDQAVTAAEVIALQTFRDLFAGEALRPGDKITVGNLTVLFTDLCSSTRLYQEIGDATAFGLVMDHFDILRAAITAEDGAIVKTIGDAVMAVFRRPVAGLRAVLAAQRQLAAPPPGKQPLLLKGALHYGPCIAVTLNERLDYFGTTINVASRLEKFAGGDVIVISDAVYTDPEVREYLAQEAPRLTRESLLETLRGLEVDKKFTLWRIKTRQEQPVYAKPEAASG